MNLWAKRIISQSKKDNAGLPYLYTWWQKLSCEGKRGKLLCRTDIFLESCCDARITADNFPLKHELDADILNTKRSTCL